MLFSGNLAKFCVSQPASGILPFTNLNCPHRHALHSRAIRYWKWGNSGALAELASKSAREALWLQQALRAIWTSRRTSAQVGLLAALGSACWFTGFATAPVALVRVVGQVEVFATLGFGHFYLREPLALREATGLLLVGAGVALALVGSLGH